MLKRHSFVITLLIYPANPLAKLFSVLAFSRSDESLSTLFIIQRSARAVLFLRFHEVTNMFGK